MMRYILFLMIFLYMVSAHAQVDKNLINQTIKENTDNARIDSISNILGYKGGDEVRVFTTFTVNKAGKIVDIKARGPHPVFENEAVRVLEKVTDLSPPKHNGIAVIPRFSLPIIFIIETEKQKKRRLKREKKELEKNKN